MFIDESGDANINKHDTRFDTFVLCGVIFRENDYNVFNDQLKAIKKKFFHTENVIFHSFEMRKKEGIFTIFQEANVLNEFYVDIGDALANRNYKIIACVINKHLYKNKYPEKNYAYEDSLTFMCERAIRYIGSRNDNSLHLCLEKRDKRKDVFLKKHYTDFIAYGTQYLSTKACEICHPKLHFRGKEENINGLQLADLCAYPIARKILSPESPQPTYEIIKQKFYSNWHGSFKGIGLKMFP
jgi:hypothetical protein